MAATVLPKQLNYSQPASLPEGTSSLSVVASPVNGATFSAGQVIQFDLIQRSGCYIVPESIYLRYRLTTTLPATAGANNALRGTPVYSTISRLEVISASSIIESISQYGMLANMLVNTRMSYAQKIGLSSLGYSSTASSTTYAFDFATNACNSLSFQTSTAANAIGANVSLAAPLGCILSNASNLVPVGVMPQLRIQLTLDTLANAYRLDGTNPITNFSWSQCELVYDCILMSPLVDQAISSRGGGQLTLKSQSYAIAGSTIGSGVSGVIEVVFNQRLASIKSLYAHICPTSSANGFFDSVDITNNNGEYSFVVAGQVIPQRPINTLLNKSSALMELSMAVGGGISDILSSNFSINPTEFGYTINAPPVVTAGSPTATAQLGKFYVGVNCERLSTNDALLTGISSQGSPISVRLSINTATTQAATLQLICLYDALLQVNMIDRTLTVLQ